TAMTAATKAGLFNPYDPTSSDPETLAALTNYEVYGKTEQQLNDLRAVIDGSLLTVPAGEIKLAFGSEYYHERFKTRKGQTVPGYAESGFSGQTIDGVQVISPIAAVPSASLARDVSSAFGEVVIPVFSDQNAVPGIKELSLTAAGRFDHYSDVGDTFNPRFGITYRPIDWLKFRASQGKSFVAPSLADAEESEVTQVIQVPAAFFAPPADLVQDGTYPAPASGQFVLGIRGNSPGITPQKADTLSLGALITPPFAKDVDLGVTYYKIDFKGVIGLPPVGGPATATLYRDYPFLVNTAPTAEEVQAVIASSDIPISACSPLPDCVYAILDIQKRNLGNFKMDGLDFTADYHPQTSFGSLLFSVNGTYELSREQSAAPGLPYSDQLKANYTRLRVRSSAGAQTGKLLSQIIWNHTAGYDIDPAGVVMPQQTHVGSFDVVNLYFRYDVDGEGMLKDVAVTFNADNVFDEAPPEFRGTVSRASSSGYVADKGSTLGRFFQLGLSKKF
ncbi:MAG: TonB-dependent receptor, partial [Chthoniobacter sp.]